MARPMGPISGYIPAGWPEIGPKATEMDKRALSERDICTKFITPALRQAGWDPRSLVAGFVTVFGASFETG